MNYFQNEYDVEVYILTFINTVFEEGERIELYKNVGVFWQCNTGDTL